MSRAREIGYRVRAARKRLALSQQRLADLADTRQATISKLEMGATDGAQVMPGIAAALGVPVEWLMAGHHPPAWAADPAAPTRRVAEDAAPPVSAPGEIPLAGAVTAGDGWARLDEDRRPLRLRGGLVAVLVRGRSAEPLVEDGQYVLADPTASWSQIPMDSIVVAQSGGGEAYCKRWSGVHGSFVFLSSIHEGRGSVVLADPEQLTVWPVVGVLFHEALR